jgi:hypothetical protein
VKRVIIPGKLVHSNFGDLFLFLPLFFSLLLFHSFLKRKEEEMKDLVWNRSRQQDTLNKVASLVPKESPRGQLMSSIFPFLKPSKYESNS